MRTLFLASVFAAAAAQDLKFLTDAGKDLHKDINDDEKSFGENACASRDKLLKEFAGKGTRDETQFRTQILYALAICEVRKGDFKRAALRFANTISEMGAPSEDALRQNQQSAHVPILKDAAESMSKAHLTEGALSLRRSRVIVERNVKAALKNIHSQMQSNANQQAPPLDLIQDEIGGYGKTGQMLPNILKQVPGLKPELHILEVLDNAIDDLDKKMGVRSASLRGSRLRLDKSKADKGQLLYVKCLVTDPVTDVDNLLSAQEIENDVAGAFVKEGTNLDKSMSLIKRSMKGKDCKDDKLEKTCAAIEKVADVQSNTFGETRVLVTKPGKKQQLESCSTNANVGILVAAKDGAKLTVKGEVAPTELKAGKPVVFDFCLESTIQSDEAVPVLFAQAWHPEFASVERTTEIRLRQQSFGLNDADVKAATKVVNDFGKKSWEKAVKQWRKGVAIVQALTSETKKATEEKAAADKEAAEAKNKAEFEGDEERKQNLLALEQKRLADKEAKEAKEEAKKKKRDEVREQERLARDPWMNSPEVAKVEADIANLKEERRDANKGLEFDLSTSLTKDISAKERELSKTIKKARKAHKKNMKDGGNEVTTENKIEGAKEEKKDEAGGNKALANLKKKLEDIKTEKAKATDDENYKLAKELKVEQDDVEKRIKKLEL